MTFPVAGDGCSPTRSVNLLNIFLIFWFYLYLWFPCPERQSLSLVFSSTQAQEPGTPQGLIPLRHPTTLRIELAPRPPGGFPQAPRPLPASLQVSYCSLPAQFCLFSALHLSSARNLLPRSNYPLFCFLQANGPVIPPTARWQAGELPLQELATRGPAMESSLLALKVKQCSYS